MAEPTRPPEVAPPLALQLYTMREAADVDFPSVLRHVAAMGYAGVELAGFHDRSPGEVGALLRELDLTVASAHAVEHRPDRFAADLDEYTALGCDTVVFPMLAPDPFGDLDGIRATADRLNSSPRSPGRGHDARLPQPLLGAAVADRRPSGAPAPLRPASTPDGGRRGRHLLGAGRRRRPCRARRRARRPRRALLHVKDGPADDPAQRDGGGRRRRDRRPGVLAAAPRRAWHIVELDRCDTDMFDAVRAQLRLPRRARPLAGPLRDATCRVAIVGCGVISPRVRAHARRSSTSSTSSRAPTRPRAGAERLARARRRACAARSSRCSPIPTSTRS